MDPIYDFAKNVVETRFEQFEKSTVEITKKFILDSFGDMIGGSSQPGCGEAADLIRYWGGREEATVMVLGGKVPALNAAFVNATMMHALELDDTHDEAVLHAYGSVLPATVATAEAVGGISGKELMTIVCLGVDLLCRLALAGGKDKLLCFSRLATCGTFAAAAAAGRVLKLDLDGMINALGIAYQQVAGNGQSTVDRALTKRMLCAFPAKAGVLSAFLAKKGITGAKNILEGKFGYFPLYEMGKYDLRPLMEDLGKRFEGDNLSIKPFPSCRWTHAPIEAAIEMAREYSINPGDIEKIAVGVSQGGFDYTGQKFSITETPQVDAQFSLAYTIAASLIRKDFFIDDVQPERIKDPSVLELAKKVQPYAMRQDKAMAPIKLEIRTKNGQLFTKMVEKVKGAPNKPVTMAECVEKFKKCCKYSKTPMNPKNIEKIISFISKLEEMKDIRDLVEVLKAKA